MRSLLLRAFIAISLFAAPLVASASALSCRLLLGHFFGLTPESTVWDVRLDQHCTVHDQGGMSTCWAYSGADILNQFLRKSGALGGNESLSVDYYVARHLEQQALHGIPRSRMEETGSVHDLFDLVNIFGIVKDSEYSFKKMGISPEMTLIGGLQSKKSRLAFFSSLKTDQVKPRALKGVLAGVSLEWAEWKDFGSSAPLEALLVAIRRELDAERPVFSGWKLSPDQFLGLSLLGYPGVDFPFYSRLADGAHSMTIVGYRLGRDGEIEKLLVKNSWGKNFGEAGLVVVDRSFLKKYLLGFYRLEE